VHGFTGSGFSGSLTVLDLEFPITYILGKPSKRFNAVGSK
jgi:hypothetical protein